MSIVNSTYKIITALLVGAAFFVACENDLQKVNEITKQDNLPVEKMNDVVLEYTDSAKLKVKLVTPFIAKYIPEEDPYIEFEEGIEVFFYDSEEALDAELSAEYAIQYPERHITEAKRNVVAINSKGEKLNTEHLIWDDQKEIIYSEEFVTITTENQVIMGKGFEADQNFSNYKIKNVTGTITLNEDEEDAEDPEIN